VGEVEVMCCCNAIGAAAEPAEKAVDSEQLLIEELSQIHDDRALVTQLAHLLSAPGNCDHAATRVDCMRLLGLLHALLHILNTNPSHPPIKPHRWAPSVNPRNQPRAHASRIVAIARQLVLKSLVFQHRSNHRDD